MAGPRPLSHLVICVLGCFCFPRNLTTDISALEDRHILPLCSIPPLLGCIDLLQTPTHPPSLLPGTSLLQGSFLFPMKFVPEKKARWHEILPGGRLRYQRPIPGVHKETSKNYIKKGKTSGHSIHKPGQDPNENRQYDDSPLDGWRKLNLVSALIWTVVSLRNRGH
jgi:hypothetical protein